MRTEPDLSSLSLDDYEVLSQALAGKCLVGMRESPFLFVKIQESHKEGYAGCYDLWLYDGFSVLESKRPFLANALPALVKWIQKQWRDWEQKISWEIKEIKNADINI